MGCHGCVAGLGDEGPERGNQSPSALLNRPGLGASTWFSWRAQARGICLSIRLRFVPVGLIGGLIVQKSHHLLRQIGSGLGIDQI